MEFRNILWVAGVSCGVSLTGLAQAQEAAPAPAPVAPTAAAAPTTVAAPTAVAPTTAVAQTSAELPASVAPRSDGHASGLMVQARVQAQSSLLSLGGTGFVLGYQGPSYSLGLGLGLSRIGVSSGGDSASIALFQITPTLTIDVWHSADGRARANFIGSVGYARASVSSSGIVRNCSSDNFGDQTCTNSNSDANASLSIIPFMIGFGGDYFLSRNFALGAEFGLQAMVLVGANSNSGGSSSSSVDAGADTEFGYGALRATFVLGD